jgi:hypothetical protein
MSDVLADLAAERAIIGACLTFDSAIPDAAGIVEPEDFYHPAHREAWAAILAQYQAGQRPDVLSVAHDCQIATEAILRDIWNDSGSYSVSNVARYANTVADWRLRRDLIHAAAAITQLAQDGTDAGEAADRAREILSTIETPVGKGAPDPDVDSFIAASPTEYDWLIPGFLERQDRLIATAGEGGGKSVLLAQIAVQAAAGIHPWTLESIPPVNVTLIDLENPRRLVSRRMSWLRSKVNRPFDPQRLRVHSATGGINLASRTDRRWLTERVLANHTDLLVIGPVYRMSAGVAAKGDIGGEDQARTITRALDELRTRCDVTLIMETHAPHGNGFGRDLRPFGASLWLRWPEFGIGLRRDPDKDGRYEIEHWRGARDERVWPKALHRATDGRTAGHWPWTPEMPSGTFRKDTA